MGRLKALPLMMSLLLLAGCAGGGGERTGEELAVALQQEYGQFTAVTCRVALTAEYDQEVFGCVLDVVWDQATGAGLTMVEPELAKGVTARIAQGETSLQYGDFSLETGSLTENGLSPMEVVPTLWGQVTGGYIAQASVTDNALEVTYRQGETSPGTGLEALVTFDIQSHAPLTGELYSDGVRVAAVRVENFQSMSGQNQG